VAGRVEELEATAVGVVARRKRAGDGRRVELSSRGRPWRPSFCCCCARGKSEGEAMRESGTRPERRLGEAGAEGAGWGRRSAARRTPLYAGAPRGGVVLRLRVTLTGGPHLSVRE